MQYTKHHHVLCGILQFYSMYFLARWQSLLCYVNYWICFAHFMDTQRDELGYIVLNRVDFYIKKLCRFKTFNFYNGY
jgi:hypothetical protein